MRNRRKLRLRNLENRWTAIGSLSNEDQCMAALEIYDSQQRGEGRNRPQPDS